MRRSLEYLNAQGLRLFAIEISYFAEPVEVFVPRIVVQPPPEPRSAAPKTQAEPVDRETFLAELPPGVSPFLADLLDACVELGAEVVWSPSGPSVRVRGIAGRASIASFERHRAYAVLSPVSGFPAETHVWFREQLREIGSSQGTAGRARQPRAGCRTRPRRAAQGRPGRGVQELDHATDLQFSRSRSRELQRDLGYHGGVASSIRLVEFPADEPARARRFWSGLLGIELHDRVHGEGEGWQTGGDGPALGLHSRGTGPGDRVSLPYFSVSDMRTTLNRVRELGGEVIHPGERWSICRDSEGSPFGLALDASHETTVLQT